VQILILDIDKLITIGGMVIRLTPLVPEMREGVCVHVCMHVCMRVVSVPSYMMYGVSVIKSSETRKSENLYLLL